MGRYGGLLRQIVRAPRTAGAQRDPYIAGHHTIASNLACQRARAPGKRPGVRFHPGILCRRRTATVIHVDGSLVHRGWPGPARVRIGTPVGSPARLRIVSRREGMIP
jgi:hypothetical protein